MTTTFTRTSALAGAAAALRIWFALGESHRDRGNDERNLQCATPSPLEEQP